MATSSYLLNEILIERDLARKPLVPEKIRGGAQGQVIKRFDRKWGRVVALKIIQYSNATNPEKAAVDVEREATALKRLTHPSIVSVLECDHDQDAQNAVLTMEWAETSLAEESGTLIDLRDLIRQRQHESKELAKAIGDPSFKSRLPESFIWHVLFHISAALARCHHGLGLKTDHFPEAFESADIIGRLRSELSFDAPSKFSSLGPSIAWQAERISFYVVDPAEPFIHRDIKPSNILLADPPKPNVAGMDENLWQRPANVNLGAATPFSVYPNILLADFGLSVPLQEAMTQGVGSQDYRAPEVPREPPRPDDPPFKWTIKQDIYSLGYTIACLMTLTSVTSGEVFSSVDALPQQYSGRLRGLVIDCLGRVADNRPTSLQLLAASIENGNWNSTFVSPYGGLIAEGFTSSILQSWKTCQPEFQGLHELPNLSAPSSSFSVDAVRLKLDNMGGPRDPFNPLCTGVFLARIKPYVQVSKNFVTTGSGNKFILSFDGGGVRVLSALFILKHLMELCRGFEESEEQSPTLEPPRNVAAASVEYIPANYFDYIAGTSTGGIVAIMIGRLRMNIDDCVTQFCQLGDSIRANRRKLSLIGPFFWPRAKYDHRQLQSFIQKIVKDRTAQGNTDINEGVFASNPALCQTLVLATAMTSECMSLYLFRTYPHWFERPKELGVIVLNPGPAHIVPIWQVAHATAAAPLYFGPMKVGRHNFIDGSMISLNPTRIAFLDIASLHGGPRAIALTVSLGSGPARQAEDDHQGMVAMTKLPPERHQEYTLYERFNVFEGLSDIAIDEWRVKKSRRANSEPANMTVERIKSATEKYLAQPDVQRRLRSVAKRLVQRRREREQNSFP